MPFLFLILTLVVTGLVMLFSASYPNAYYNRNGDSFYFIRNQLIFAVAGVIIMFVVSYMDYRILKKFAVTLLAISFGFLILVLFMPKISGVHRWITFGSFNFQPSEITKFAIVVSFAHFINLNFSRMNTFKYGIFPYLIILAPTIVLLALEPHISCTAIVILLAAGMLFIGGVQLRWFGMVLGTISAALLYLVLFTDKLTYANNRIAGWLDPFGPGTTVDTWQTRQGLYAIGSGGIFGLGLGNSRQKYLYIPEPQNDFVFAVVCEELGFIGAVIIILIFAMLIWRGMVISIRAKDKFGCLLGIGLTAQAGLQVVLNIAVVTNTIPNTGISLPFFSYGGTSLLMLLAQMGVILSISRKSNLETS
ncbi:MAG: FtsW/RodA/SpoVE family cell cycle protein [Candidatus Paraimprobicoccus trichonymphae]|uniref:Probable peptidoglycan glycosyltransferase FtsW n=1 Tax=Candidatus Paraimprobicoccus trichonymphae TaxID=3033793 RepID=A0AA48HWL7_9FIRM|nr:MAG: FtsW/RodA/SpoVE family cell cycle protein [Candidatus Paraimprobicoccus trichonymphae]